MTKKQKRILDAIAELKEAVKQMDYVEDVDIIIHIHQSNNFVDTVEKAVTIVDEIFGEHKTVVLDTCVVVKYEKMQPPNQIDFAIFLENNEQNVSDAMDEGFEEVVEEEKKNDKVNMS